MSLPTDSVPIPPPTPSTESPDRLLRTYGRTNEEGVVTTDQSPTFRNARGSEKQDLVAEQIWGVLVASAREGVTNPNVIAHAAARNVLIALAEEAS